MKWIAVKKRLPSNEQEILTYWAEEDQIQVQRFYENYANLGPWWMFGWQNHQLKSNRITHWMPLPKPPKVIENDDRRDLESFFH